MSNPSYTCTLHAAQVFSIKSGYEYAVFTVTSLSTGYHMLAIESSFGDGYAYAWGAPGKCFYRFLARLGIDYVLGKMVHDTRELDLEATRESIRKEILKARRRKDMSADEAITEWSLIENEWEHVGDFHDWQRDTEYFSEPHEMAYERHTARARQFIGLYEKFWPAFAAELLKAAPPIETTEAKSA